MADEPSLPPFPALRAFQAAARHGRFKDAARDLGLTESAISHQIRRLEDLLRVPLFARNGPRVRLTVQGARYYQAIDPALGQIAEATRALMGPSRHSRVALTLPPSLASLWLIPNLAVLEQAHPEIDLQLVTTTRLCDLKREQIDLAIRHGGGAWPDVESVFLLAEAAMPVCKPGYLEETAGEDPIAAIGRGRLIVNGYYPDEWTEWAAARGLAPPALDGALKLEAQDQVLAAAERGLGLAMGRSPMVDARLADGSLVAPFGLPHRSGAGLYLCWARDAAPSAASRRVARWLQTLAKAPGDGITSRPASGA